MKEVIFYGFWFLFTFTGCEIAEVFVGLTDFNFGSGFQLLIEEDEHPEIAHNSKGSIFLHKFDFFYRKEFYTQKLNTL